MLKNLSWLCIYLKYMDGLKVGEIKSPHAGHKWGLIWPPRWKIERLKRDKWTNQRVTVNLPLASANRSSADAESTLRIGFENVRILRDTKLGQLYRRWHADSSSIPQATQIGSSETPMLYRCLFNRQCPVMSPTKILNLELGSLSKYLVKPRLGFFIQILDWRQEDSKLHKAQCALSKHSRSFRLTLKGADERAKLDPALACASVSSFLWIPQCPGTHTS
jgi:hypothetical protein